MPRPMQMDKPSEPLAHPSRSENFETRDSASDRELRIGLKNIR